MQTVKMCTVQQIFMSFHFNGLIKKIPILHLSSSRLHFDVSTDPSAPSPFPCSYTPSNPYCDSPNAPSSPSDLDGGFYGAHGQHLNPSGSNAGLTQQPRQKGRPRKRKPKDIEAMTANLGEFCKFYSHNLTIVAYSKHASYLARIFFLALKMRFKLTRDVAAC